MTEAARTLNKTQPGVSAQIKSLEHLIGKPLFIREKRSIRPTPIADQLALAVSSSLDHIEGVMGQMKARSAAIEGTVYIAVPKTFGYYCAASELAKLLSIGLSLRILTGGREFIV